MNEPDVVIDKEWMTICFVYSAMSRDTEVKNNVTLTMLATYIYVLVIESIEVFHLFEYLKLVIVVDIQHTSTIAIVLPTIFKQLFFKSSLFCIKNCYTHVILFFKLEITIKAYTFIMIFIFYFYLD